ncbi:unnamed protein product [Mycena citricolor]|uniref:Uncharacterized protein n=1 Tax=Mycena citricolor TaxID=2018698 RepID=A0AAD2HJB6_9AGAR|nr:unnamed protein product [Mycena citricolor]
MSSQSSAADLNHSGTPTVLKELTSSAHTETYGVTKALEKLLRVVAQDALTFPRNIHSAYTAISIARYALDDIKALIKSVDKDEFSPVTWDNFVKYTTLIPILENFCLSFERISHAESQATLTSGTISVAALSLHLAEWETRRKLLGDLLRGFPKDFVSAKVSFP